MLLETLDKGPGFLFQREQPLWRRLAIRLTSAPPVGKQRRVIPAATELVENFIIQLNKLSILPMPIRVVRRGWNELILGSQVEAREVEQLGDHRGAGAVHPSYAGWHQVLLDAL